MNKCKTCKTEIPLMGKTGREKVFCSRECKQYFTNHLRHFDIELAKLDASVCDTEDTYRMWAEEWCLDAKGAYRRKILEDKFAKALDLEDFISTLKEFIDTHPSNDLLTRENERFNAWLFNTSRKLCPICEKNYPKFRQTKWRTYCSEKCCNIAKRNGGILRKYMDERCIEVHGVLGANTEEIMKRREINNLEKYGVRNPMMLDEFVIKSLETRSKCDNLYRSKAELEIQEYIEGLGFRCDNSVYNICPGKEIDIFVPSRRLAIEYNGSYWHSEANGGLEIARNRHIYKTENCEKLGFRLLHIFEDVYKNDRDKVLNIIRESLKYETDEFQYIELNEDEVLYKTKDNKIIGSVRFKIEEGTIMILDHTYPNNSLWLGLFISTISENYKFDRIVIEVDRCFVSRFSNVYLDNDFVETSITPPREFYVYGNKPREDVYKESHNRIYDCGTIVYELVNKKGAV